jgi:hypothetical protein
LIKQGIADASEAPCHTLWLAREGVNAVREGMASAPLRLRMQE